MSNFTFIDRLVFRAPAFSFLAKNDPIPLEQFREFVYLASPTLAEEFEKLGGNSTRDEKERKRIAESYHNYFSRSYSRCTPFGLFAGIGVCNWSETTNIIVDEQKRRITRLDMHYVSALGQYISSIRGIQEHLVFYPNNSIYFLNDKLRYVEFKIINKVRKHQINEVINDEYLNAIIARARSGATIRDLALSIIGPEIKFQDAERFVLEIIDAQLLKSELEPNLTGEIYFSVLISKLSRLYDTVCQGNGTVRRLLSLLREVDDLLKQLDVKPVNKIEAYREIKSLLLQLPVKLEDSYLFQTDLFFDKSYGGVCQKIQEDLLACFNLLNIFRSNSSNNLKKFTEDFFQKYEYEEIPLLLALDTEVGIGYGKNKGTDNNPLIENLKIPNQSGDSRIDYNNLDTLLHDKIRDAHLNRAYEVEIMDEDFQHFKTDYLDLPPTMYAKFSMPSRNKVLFNYIAGPCAAKILGRFAGNDENILRICNEIAEHENNFYSDKIIAEIVHLPDGRVGNVTMRPTFRTYEIPYLAAPNVSREYVIDLNDLYISIKENKIVLRSKRLNKEIIPRLTVAHNTSTNALPVYQFLFDLQSQYAKSEFEFNWGEFSFLYKFEPRALYRNIILKAATWRFSKNDIRELLDFGYNTNVIDRFRKKWMLPDRVLLSEGDNTLLVDWNSNVSVNCFLSSVKGKSNFMLTEFIFDTENAAVIDHGQQPYTNEFIAFIKNNNQPNTRLSNNRQTSAVVKRKFPPGSEWLYYKIYTGSKTADQILHSLRPLIEDLLKQNTIDKWFFIRYADPDIHIRMRFHVTDLNQLPHLSTTLSEKLSSLIDAEVVWKIQTDTYCREIERYGNSTMELCESYFFYDSCFIVNALEFVQDDEGESKRSMIAFRAIDEFLDSFQLDLKTKMLFIRDLAKELGWAYGMDRNLKISLDQKFRLLRKDIEFHLKKTHDHDKPHQTWVEALDHKTLSTRGIAKTLAQLSAKNELEVNLENLMYSLMHMMLNRMFKSEQRLHELVIYSLLAKYYESEMARTRN